MDFDHTFQPELAPRISPKLIASTKLLSLSSQELAERLQKEAGEKEKERIRKASAILKKLNAENIVKYYGSTLKCEELWVRKSYVPWLVFPPPRRSF